MINITREYHDDPEKSVLSIKTGVILLLALYVASFVSSSGAPHNHHVADHQTEDGCLTDACHVSIYHPGNQNGCDHRSHLSNSFEECSMCHLVVSHEQLLSEAIQFSATPKKLNQNFAELTGHPSLLALSSKDRGPPHRI